MTSARLVETHTAYVLLLEDVALKWKKPLDLGFADFSTVQARHAACEAEVRLNSRLAPDVYDGVCTLRDARGHLLEPVVRMHRLPDEARLSAVVSGGVDVGPAVRELARTLARFHAGFTPREDAAALAGPARLRELWLVGLRALAHEGADIVDPRAVGRAYQLVLGWLDGRGVLLQERIDAGCVRDGHGDLLADDVFVLPDGLRVLDCLDFDETLRCGDIVSDVASLVADLERLGARPEAEAFLEAYARESGDRPPASLTHVYVAYRAQVRAKVACIRAGQTDDDHVRAEQADAARTLVALMLHHLEAATVRLVLVGGLPGSGKSSLAAALAAETGAQLISTDTLRDDVLGPRRGPSAPGHDRYAPEQVHQVYEELLARARDALTHGTSVVLDASWADPEHRAAAAALAQETSTALTELVCAVPDAMARTRLEARPGTHESEADPTVRTWMAARFAPWPSALEIDTSRPPSVCRGEALHAMARSRRVVSEDSVRLDDERATVG